MSSLLELKRCVRLSPGKKYDIFDPFRELILNSYAILVQIIIIIIKKV